MLNPEQQAAFAKDGFFRIRGAFSRAEAAEMERKVWEALKQQYGAERNAPTTWRNVSQACHLQNLKLDPAYLKIGSLATLGGIDALLGAGHWRQPPDWGQFLVNFPQKDQQWNVPVDLWHTDFGFTSPPHPLAGVLVFSYLADVSSHAGGTVVLAGSHHIVQDFVEQQPRARLAKMKNVRKALMQSDSWLVALTTPNDGKTRVAQFMEAKSTVSGFSVQVVELSGEAGDVVICHPWLLHAPAPNCGEQPRMMCIQRIHRTGTTAHKQT